MLDAVFGPRRVLPALVAVVLAASAARAQVEILGSTFRADQPFPEFNSFGHEDAVDPEATGEAADYAARPKADATKSPAPARPAGKPASAASAAPPLGGSLHVFVRNTGKTTLKVSDVTLAGTSLKEALAFSGQRIKKKFASIYFAKLSPGQIEGLLAAGEPVWWKADPPAINPGTVGEIVVRLRSRPRAQSVPVGIRCSAGTAEATVAVPGAAPRIEGISFAPGLREVFLYFRHPAGNGTAPSRILLDTTDITESCTIASDGRTAITPVVARLPKALADASFHVFTGAYGDKSVAIAGIRAWSDDFAYGMFGGKPGGDNDVNVGREYLEDLLRHNVNVQMPQIGSAAVQKFFRDESNQRLMASRGFRFVLTDAGKFGIKDPFALYVHDEPDCGDYKAEGLAEDKKIGALAQYVISHGDEMRAAAPTVPQMLNVNMTYKPHNWYTYGQIPDIFTVDPYYQVRLKDAFWEHPERIPTYTKATYIYMVSKIAQSSAAPKPLHVILYGNSQVDKKKNRTFRFPTPAEKRIEVYYALAGGAKGLSYWWYTPGAPARGLGAAAGAPAESDAARIWREVGLLGAETRTAGPVLTTACPIELPAQGPRSVWTRFLAAGTDTLVLLAVNNQYANSDKGTKLTPVKDALVTVPVPAWIKSPRTFEITAAGTKAVATKLSGGQLEVDLGSFDVTRMVVITGNTGLQAGLQQLYASRFAANTAALLKSGK